MPYWLYSHESLPSQKLMGKPGYSPEWFMWGGVRLPQLVEGEWLKIPDTFYVYHRNSWRDRAVKEAVTSEEILEKLKIVLGKRGVQILDHEPSKEEEIRLADRSKNENYAYRMTVIEEYENAVREKETTGVGRTRPTPYENECYEILGLTKPYSVEAMRAQRHPGEAVGAQIVAALERLEERRAQQTEAAKSPERRRLEKIAAEADDPKGLVPAMRK